MRQVLRYDGMMLLLCLLFAAVGGGAQEAPSPDGEVSIFLDPVEDGFMNSLTSMNSNTEVAFKKEPAYSGDKVYRNALRCGDGPSDFIGMALDASANMLYLDRNRNLDLTDDGPAIIAQDEYGLGYGEFSNVPVELTLQNVPVRYFLDITFYGSYSYQTVKSGWQGEFEFSGRKCTVGISDDLDGKFEKGATFRFDHERNRDARLACGEVDEIPLPKWMCFEGKNYLVDCSLASRDGKAALAVKFSPVTEDLMDVTFEGQFVSRVLLQDDDEGFAMLDWPTPAMRIPRGSYALFRVDLMDSFSGDLESEERLVAGGNALLKTGGPVNQTVSARRQGASLSLGYVLKGIDSVEYLPDISSEASPGFAIYQNDRKVGSGQFEYG